MADVGPGPAELIIKRIEVNIIKYQHSIKQQELELLEMQDRMLRIQVNIDATKEALEREYEILATTKEQYSDPNNEVSEDG
jgi:hypothetical protein